MWILKTVILNIKSIICVLHLLLSYVEEQRKVINVFNRILSLMRL